MARPAHITCKLCIHADMTGETIRCTMTNPGNDNMLTAQDHAQTCGEFLPTDLPCCTLIEAGACFTGRPCPQCPLHSNEETAYCDLCNSGPYPADTMKITDAGNVCKACYGQQAVNQTWRIYVADTDTDCLIVEASREDAISAFEGLRESCWNGWMYGPVTAELEVEAQANGWVDDTPRTPEERPSVIMRINAKLGR